MREHHVVYQVQLLVTKGTAHFQPTLPSGLTAATARDGWITLATFYGEGNSAEQIPTVRPETQEKQSEEDDSKCSLQRAKEYFTTFQFNTLRQLTQQGCEARLRLRPFEGRTALLETTKHHNIQVLED